MPTTCDVTVTDLRAYNVRGRFGISVLDYGADATGVVDSWAAFQRAIRDCWNDVWKNGNNYQGRSGGVLFIPRGRYKISRTLEVSYSAAGTPASPKAANGVMLVGEGGQTALAGGTGSVLFKSSDFVGEALLAVVGTQGFTMTGMVLDGSRATQGSPATSGIILQNVGNPVMRDIVVINNAGWGVWVANTNLYSLSGVVARNNGLGGIRLTSGMQAYSCYRSRRTPALPLVVAWPIALHRAIRARNSKSRRLRKAEPTPVPMGRTLSLRTRSGVVSSNRVKSASPRLASMP